MKKGVIQPVCRRGHPQTPENRIVFPSCPLGRCRLCREDDVWLWREEHRAEALQYTRAWQQRKKEQAAADE